MTVMHNLGWEKSLEIRGGLLKGFYSYTVFQVIIYTITQIKINLKTIPFLALNLKSGLETTVSAEVVGCFCSHGVLWVFPGLNCKTMVFKQ